jgi:hypothetical protein
LGDDITVKPEENMHRKGSFQNLNTGLDNTRVDGKVIHKNLNELQIKVLVGEKYSNGRGGSCLTSITCTPCITKK